MTLLLILTGPADMADDRCWARASTAARSPGAGSVNCVLTYLWEEEEEETRP